MAKKVIVGLVATVLIGVVCAGAIIALVNSTKKASSHSDDNSSSLSATSKSMTAMCSTALHKDSCESTISKLQTNSSATPNEVFKSFVDLAIKEFESAAQNSAEVTKAKLAAGNDTRTAAAVSDCKKFLDDALEDMKGVSSLVGKDMKNLTAEADNIVHMLSSSMTYLYTCVDGFEDPKLNADMNNALNNATEMSSNVLGVITSIASFAEKLQSVDLGSLTSQGTNRKLLGYDMDKQGYPSWLSAGDRKLLQATTNSAKPNAVVAKDGSGQYKTINDAVKAIPKNHPGRYVIYVKAGVYDEIVMVPKGTDNVLMYGDGADKSIVTGDKSNVKDKVTTRLTSTFSVEGANFIAKDMGFRNTAGAVNHQAVALRISGDFGAFFKCRFDGFQDTLYTHAGRQFFRDCTVSGTIDFIFGNSAVVFQNCVIICNLPMDNQLNTVTAHGRTDPNMKTGIVLQNCQFVADKALEPVNTKIASYLGRPWKLYSRTVVMESSISDVIRPEGWVAWDGDFALKTLYYAEYANTGPGAATAGRVKWPTFHVINKAVATQFTAGPFLNSNNWIASTGVANYLGFNKA
ncbi:pectin methylesterase1 [Carex littledalei]|uniref:Pectinesterase n=1 Tax=Carex littledalei TaxID=544730 RepID=A0A833VJI3_9POAL|nr:pectin methylesterase1 [Carex littledalei]